MSKTTSVMFRATYWKLHTSVLLFTVLLHSYALDNGIALGCTLCPDGSTIGNPDYVVDLTEPFPLKTCGDLNDALVFVDDGSSLCESSRALAALCGCPTADDSCSICGGESTPSRPDQVLDGLVEMTGVLGQPTFGLARTCALVESTIRQYDAGETQCLDLPVEDLRSYCGCATDDEEESTVCTLCPGGEVVEEPENHFTFNGGTVSCREAKEIVANTEKGTDTCNAVQQVSTLCGCPIPWDSCEICKNGGAVLDGCKVIRTPSKEEVSCRTFEAQMRSLESSNSQCLSLDPIYAEQCGCTEVEEFIPCTLCPHGEAVPYPDKYIYGLENIGIDFLGDYTCRAIEDLIRSLHETSQTCTSGRLVSKACGCKPVSDNACSFCGAGNTMNNPYKEVVFNFGSTGAFFEGLRESIDVAGKYTCEVSDSAFSYSYSEDDNWCYWNHLMRGDACGCDDTRDAKALIWTQRCSAVLSLFGSVFIIAAVLTKQKKIIFSTYNQIILCISFFDILSSIAYIIGTSFTPTELGLHGAIGNDATCGFQAWLFQMGFTSVFYNVILCVYFLLVVKYNWTDRRFRKIGKWVHLTVFLIGFGLSLAVIPFATPDWRWCYVGTPPQTNSWLPAVFLFILPVALSILAITVITFIFVLHVRSAGHGRSQELRVNPREGKINALIRRTMWQSVWFLAAFYAVWPIQFAAMVIVAVPSSYWVYLVAALLGPLQGLLNAMVFFYRERWSPLVRISRSCKQNIETFKGVYGKLTTSVVETRERQEVSEVVTMDKSEQQLPVDHSEFDDDEVVQIDLSLSAIEAYGKENAESENGVLEHAVYADMLNEEDLAFFNNSVSVP